MNTKVKDRLRCAYGDCAEAHPLANESTFEQVTCLTCRAALGLPPTDIYKNPGATIAATPEPRAGEHTKGPWKPSHPMRMDAQTVNGSVIRVDGPQFAVAILSEYNIGRAEAHANARRIVACVNACEGIVGELPNMLGLLDTIERIITERDLLRERERELVGLLQLAETLRPALLKDFGYVPEYVLDFCNRARALSKHGR